MLGLIGVRQELAGGHPGETNSRAECEPAHGGSAGGAVPFKPGQLGKLEAGVQIRTALCVLPLVQK